MGKGYGGKAEASRAMQYGPARGYPVGMGMPGMPGAFMGGKPGFADSRMLAGYPKGGAFPGHYHPAYAYMPAAPAGGKSYGKAWSGGGKDSRGRDGRDGKGGSRSMPYRGRY